MNPEQAAKPLFDPDIVSRHVPASFILECLTESLGGEFTDGDVSAAIPHPGMNGRRGQRAAHGEAMAERVLSVLEELRDLRLLRPVPHGADRGVAEAIEWNGFVAHGRSGISEHGLHHLMRCPLPAMIARGAWDGAYDALLRLREDRGLDRHVGHDRHDRVGPKADLPMTPADLPVIAQAAADHARLSGSGMKHNVMMGRDVNCPRTGARLAWKERALLDPSLGIWHHPQPGKPGPFRLEDLGPWEAPRPLRHVEITLPSGVLMMADWFRVPGFNEGVEVDDAAYVSINSERGVDERTRDHFERLGLMRVHTTNCVLSLVRDGDAVRVGWFDYDLPNEDGFAPDVLGQICCDLWDATFADREILIDILVAGGERLAANGGKDRHGHQVSDYATTREEAAMLLDAYDGHGYVQRIMFDPDTRIHVYMAAGHGAENFHEMFRGSDLSDWEFMDDMFVLSTRELALDPLIADVVEEADWAWPARYIAPEGPDLVR